MLNICEQESENLFGVIVQFGGQTPLKLADALQAAGVPIIGTSPKSIEIAEDRKLFGAMLDKLGIRQTAGGTATTEEEAVTAADAVGYPVLVRPSFVLGGRGMQLVHNETDLRRYVRDAIEASPGATPGTAANPILVDHFLEDASRWCRLHQRRRDVVIGAIMEHIEEAASTAATARAHPPFTFKEEVKAEITKATRRWRRAERARPDERAVRGEGRRGYVLEVNPRASRTRPS